MHSRIPVLHTVDSIEFSKGGPSRSVSGLLNALVETSFYDLCLLTGNASSNDVEVNDLVTRGYARRSIFPIPPGLNILEYFNDSPSITKPKLIHTHGIWQRSSLESIELARRMKVPIIVSPRGMLEPWALSHARIKKKLAWLLFQKGSLAKTTAFHATSQAEAENIRKLGFSQPIAIIPNGITPPTFVEPKVQPSSSVRTALFLSRIHPKKGLPMLLDAWSHIAPENWRLRIVGNDDGNHLKTIVSKINKLNIQDTVTIDQPLYGSEKWRAFQDSNLFILPSYSENFGIAIAEALACGIPVITTKCCPWGDLEANKCGWWVDAETAAIEEALASALSCSEKTLTEMGKRGQSYAMATFNWKMIGDKMASFYNSILTKSTFPEFVV